MIWLQTFRAHYLHKKGKWDGKAHIIFSKEHLQAIITERKVSWCTDLRKKKLQNLSVNRFMNISLFLKNIVPSYYIKYLCVLLPSEANTPCSKICYFLDSKNCKCTVTHLIHHKINLCFVFRYKIHGILKSYCFITFSIASDISYCKAKVYFNCLKLNTNIIISAKK